VDQIRILITAMPRLLHEIVERMVASQPDMSIAGQMRQSESIAAAATRTDAVVVILCGSEDQSNGGPWRVLEANPRLKLLAIGENGRRAARYELRPHKVVIEDVSAASLVDAIRAMTAGLQ
jgi:hypothetical protein